MKNTKKLTAMMLSGAMALSLSLSLAAPLAAFADTPPSITINADESGHTFTGYQILTGTLTDGQLFNTAWGADILASGATSPTDLLAALKADATFGSNTSNLFYNVTTAPQFADVISKFDADSDEAVELAKVIADNVKGSGTAIPYNSTSKKYSSGDADIDTGYYLVVDSTANTGTNNIVKSRYLLQVADTVEVNAKVVKPTLDKNIVIGTGTDATTAKANTAGMGDIVNFELSSAVPDMTGYSQYYYIIEDTLSPGFIFNADTAITIGTDTLTASTTGDYSVYTETVTNGTKITIVFRDFYDKWNDDAGDAITVKYSAKVDTDADCTTAGNPNTAQLIYSNDPNYKGRGDGNDSGGGDSNTPEDPGSDDTGTGGGTGGPGSGDDKDIPGEYGGPNTEGGSGTKDGEKGYVSETAQVETKTYLTSVKINKVDESNIALPGAEFSITGTSLNTVKISGNEFVEDDNGTYALVNGAYVTPIPTDYSGDKYKKVTYSGNTAKVFEKTVTAKAYVNDSGVLMIEGLGEGTYTITEVTAPSGYNLLSSGITVVVKGTIGTDNSVTWSVGNGSSDLVKLSTDKNSYELTVENKKGTLLPTTGGMGTTIFYIVGGILVSASAIFIITKKRTANAVE